MNLKQWNLLHTGAMVLLMVGCVTGEKQIKQISPESFISKGFTGVGF